MTPAIKQLEKNGIDHEVVSYDHDPAAQSYGLEAAEALGLDPSEVFKTLMAKLDGGQLVVAVIPVDSLLNLKSLAKAAGAKKAAMADPGEAERVTGYVVGGISPLGQRKRHRTFVDVSAADRPTINVSAGRRGLEVRLAPHDLVAQTSATLAPLT